MNGSSNTVGPSRGPSGSWKAGPYIAQRFAIDWVKSDENGQTFSGDQLDNRSYYAYGAEGLPWPMRSSSAQRMAFPKTFPAPHPAP